MRNGLSRAKKPSGNGKNLHHSSRVFVVQNTSFKSVAAVKKKTTLLGINMVFKAVIVVTQTSANSIMFGSKRTKAHIKHFTRIVAIRLKLWIDARFEIESDVCRCPI